jgi:amino acid permease
MRGLILSFNVDIGAAAFQRKGYFVVGGLFYCEIIAACTMYICLGGNTLNDLLHSYHIELSVKICTLITAVVIFPTTLIGNISLLGKFSFLGVLVSTTLICTILYDGKSIQLCIVSV